jgi:hypothetical protein
MDADKLIGALTGVTKKWCKQKKKEERAASARLNRSYAMCRSSRYTIRDAAFDVMEGAYLKASANGTLPAMARQIMYAARGPIQDRTGERLESQYFTQTLLPDYLGTFPEKTAHWDVVFDARGHFHEPHTGVIVPLGTLDVRAYLRDVQTHTTPWPVPAPFAGADDTRFPTCGPRHRFGAILFVEKEGFLPLFERVRLAERYDLAIMSTKGMSVTASRLLVDRLSRDHSAPVLVLRDFDKAGFSIAASFTRSSRRYIFQCYPRVIDLGLRLADVAPNGLESEDVFYPKGDPTSNLRENGATEEEIAFLYNGRNHGRRVELNAFTSDALVAWIESKLEAHGVEKVVPTGEALTLAYRRVWERRALAERTAAIARDTHDEAKTLAIPGDLESQIRVLLDDDPGLPWDAAVAKAVEAGAPEKKHPPAGTDLDFTRPGVRHRRTPGS